MEKVMTKREVVEYVSKEGKLKTYDSLRLFYIFDHYCTEDEYDAFVHSPYDQETLETICAYIQFEFDKIQHAFSPVPCELAEVLYKFYNCLPDSAEDLEFNDRLFEIDLSNNWEIYCAVAEDIEKIPHLHREGMHDFLLEIINREEQ